jgi:hypothetical protein
MTLATWQRTNILTAMNYLKEIARTGKDQRAGSLAQGLAEVLEPNRRAVRLEREAAQAATAVAGTGRERRVPADRRRTTNRRQNPLPFGGSDRRVSIDRRAKRRRGPSS